MKLTIVAGARPNFMKIAPIIHQINTFNNPIEKISYELVHTGQHYDKNMSSSFFDELEIPKPSINLECGSGTQAQITSKIMISFENYLKNKPSDLVIVVGDVTSTMACAIVSRKLNIKVAHIEAGIRSYDWKMPEEINRIVTDSITNYFFTTSKIANENLLKSGFSSDNIFYVGNTMIDTLIKNLPKLNKPNFWNKLNLHNKEYIVITLHRPSNVDQRDNLKKIINDIILNSKNLDLIFPMHPRTSKVFKSFNLKSKRLHIVNPLSYLEFNYLVKNSKAVITDSGGITEETTYMGIPCITLRDSTERPETVTEGTNELIGSNPESIKPILEKLFEGRWKKGTIPELWDGKTSERIINKLSEIYNLS